MKPDPTQAPLWTKSFLAVVFWIGAAMAVQMFVVGAWFWGGAKGDPGAAEYLMSVRGIWNPVARPWVWWISWSSERLAACGLAVLAVSGLVGNFAGWRCYKWYIRAPDYRGRMFPIIKVVAYTYLLLAIVGLINNALFFGWQFVKMPR